MSATTAAAGRPINLQTTISGRNLGFVYHFIGRTLPEEQAILIEDIAYVQAADTQEIDGVAYPAWPAEDVAVDLDWEPRVVRVCCFLKYEAAHQANRCVHGGARNIKKKNKQESRQRTSK